MINGEHRRDPLAIGGMHQRCVGEVHGTVGVALHQFIESRKVVVHDGKNGDRIRPDQIPMLQPALPDGRAGETARQERRRSSRAEDAGARMPRHIGRATCRRWSRKASRAPVSASPSTRTATLQRRSHATAGLFRSIRIAPPDRSGTAERLVAHPELRRGVVSIRRVAHKPVGDDRSQQAGDARLFGASSPLQRLLQRRVEPPTVDFVLLHCTTA